MSNLLLPVELPVLAAVVGGSRSPYSDDPVLHALTGISSSLQQLGHAHNRGGFSSIEMMMLAMMMSRRGPASVFVRRPCW